MRHAKHNPLERFFWKMIIPTTILTCFLIIIFCGGFIYMEMQEHSKIVESETITETIYLSDMRVEVRTMNVSGYAPLDPKAKKGMCFSGDRRIAASGAKVKPYITVAAPPEIPFGTLVQVEGIDGTFIVEDRGGAIKGDKLDICFLTRDEALKFGRQSLAVVFFYEE